MSIAFTQYLRPDGRKRSVTTERPEPIEALARRIVDAGYAFECEELMTGDVSLTITNDEGDADIELVANGPDVPAAVDRLIERFAATLP